MLTVRWKCLAGEPEFAVERYVGQAGDEPVRSMIDVAKPRKELLAVPPSPHAVELLAHPPAGQVRIVFPGMGEEQLRCGIAVFLGGLWYCRSQRAQPVLFRLFAPVGPQMFARPAFNGYGLISPCRASAGIDSADVLQDVGRPGRAFDFGRFAVF